VWAYGRDGVSARTSSQASLKAVGLSDLRNPRIRSQKFWAGSSQGHYADTPSRRYAHTRLLFGATSYRVPPLLRATTNIEFLNFPTLRNDGGELELVP
jgi:hypothetical protein